MRTLLFATVLLAMPALAQRKTGSPLEHLQKSMEVLTHFGERADISPDNQRIAFMAKSFGDAFVVDRETRTIRCLTCSIPGTAFLRVMHLANGDYILIGPERFKDLRTSRRDENELWYLSSRPGAKPQRLDQRMSEGAAVSKKNLRMAWSETSAQNRELAPGASRLVVADVEVSGGTARLTNKRAVHERKDASCVLEAQDFFDEDTKMTFSCYEPKGMASVWTLDLKTGEAKNQSLRPGTYNEVEGIFPDGVYTLVEADKQVETLGGEGGFRQIDIWKLKLDGTGKDFTRVTNFNDYEGWKASNPVVATNGQFMAFQVAKTTDEAGVGYGIVVHRLK